MEKLENAQVQRAAEALLTRMEHEPDSRVLASLGVTLATLVKKPKLAQGQRGAELLVMRMRHDADSDHYDALASLGDALATLADDGSRGQVQSLAEALVTRMQREADNHDSHNRLAFLGGALAALAEKLELSQVQRDVAALVKRIVEAPDTDVGSLHVWISLESHLGQRTRRERVQACVDLMKAPLGVDVHEALLTHLESIVGVKFEGDIWRFVEWATTREDGKALHLDLD